MPTDTTSQLISAMFSNLSSSNTISPLGTLSDKLGLIVDRPDGQDGTVDVEILTLFATASVEMWQRSVHSFLISVSLTETSPLWASVSGYYSSHYSVRAFAHLLGYFQLYKKKKIFQVKLINGKYGCDITRRQGGDSEHKYYWTTVKDCVNDPFFTKNNEDKDHRNKANYADHVNCFPDSQVMMDEVVLKQRIQKLSENGLSEAPIPDVQKCPDTKKVQLVAYHRLVRFRKYVDEVLGDSNLFWTDHRTPGWCSKFIDFQIVEPESASGYKEQSL